MLKQVYSQGYLLKSMLGMLVLIALVVLLSMWYTQPTAYNTQQQTMLRPQTVRMAITDIERAVTASGLVQPQLKVDVGTQASGRITELHVKLGQTVKKGDLLVSLDPEFDVNNVDQAKATLQQQESSLFNRKVDLNLVAKEAERQKRLFDGQATTKTDYYRAQAELEKIQSDVNAQIANANKLRADLANAKLRLAYTNISAPIDGVVVSIALQTGQVVNALQQTPTLLTLAQMDNVTVRAQIPEAELPMLRIGQEASFTSLGQSKSFTGPLHLINPLPESGANGVYYNAMYDVANPADEAGLRALGIGMTGQSKIVIESAKQVNSLPVSTLGKKIGAGRYEVQVLSANGDTEKKIVSTGLHNGDLVEIRSGLSPSDEVLLYPQESLLPALSNAG